MNQQEAVQLPQMEFPKGGGAIQGMGEALSGGGMSGAASLSLPLPISSGRGFAPGLSLGYGSGTGNGPFGLGWGLSLPSIARRTAKGVPRYDEEDEFLGPSGEILLPELDAQGQVISTTRELAGTGYRVVRYFPCVEGGFDRLERWQAESGTLKNDHFWLQKSADGSQHLYGKQASVGSFDARIEDPEEPNRIVRWLPVESVSVDGQHIFYQYKVENDENIDTGTPGEAPRERRAQRYLKRVLYGNHEAHDGLYVLSTTGSVPGAEAWHFELVLDYGEHQMPQQQLPQYWEQGTWAARADAFSDYSAGFEVRTHRLCHQVLMFHRFAELNAGQPTLVNSLALEYAETSTLSCLQAATVHGYGVDPASAQEAQAAMPPLEFGMSLYDQKAARFEPFEALADMHDGMLYQLVDLYGEGLPGVLFRDGSSYLYRAPQRAEAAEAAEHENAVAYGPWAPLPQLPTGGLTAQSGRALMDLSGDGRLDWVVTAPGLAGFFNLGPDGQWQGFTPFSAFPTEFLADGAQLVDLIGSGVPGLALIGPKSVRLYANQRDGRFAAPQEVAHEGEDSLPSFAAADTELVAFADVLGSGQSHLVRVRADRLECWPNLGHGRFGKPIQLASLPFAAASFDPRRVFLADLDGNGTADLIYIEVDRLRIFANQSGNSFAAPTELLFPDELRYDDLCLASFADVTGSGCASLVLTCPHMKLRHWICEFSPAGKPYLLNRYNNNRGLDAQIVYRSSAQEWLDQKQDEPAAACHLPFPVQVVSRQISHDEISGNTLTQRYLYRHAYYDGHWREYRGFGLVIHRDAEADVQNPDKTLTAPVETRTWYCVGAAFDADRSDYNQADAQAWALGATRYVDADDQPISEPQAAWLSAARRALSGRVRRVEVYGLDDAPTAALPYSVSESRFQVREVRAGAQPVLLPQDLESIAWQYERDMTDPLVAHQVLLEADRYGSVTRSASINYARRPNPSTPEECNDEQQEILYLTEQTQQVLHLDGEDVWRLGLSYESRTEVLHWERQDAPQGLLSYEVLSASNSPLNDSSRRELTGWARVYYRDPARDEALPLGQASREGLISHTHQAEATPELLAEAFAGHLEGEQLRQTMEEAGYLPAEGYYWIPSAQTCYLPRTGFLRVDRQIDPFGAVTQVEYDPYYCSVTKITDAVGNVTQAEFDYRHLTPWRLIDLNDNVQEVAYDPLGRVRVSAFYGTEEGLPVGFDPVEDYRSEVLGLEQALEDPASAINRSAVVYYEEPFSWMPQLRRDALAQVIDADAVSATVTVTKIQAALQAWGWVTAEGRVRARHRFAGTGSNCLVPQIEGALRAMLEGLPREPVHSAVLTHDRYPDDPERQIRCALVFADGFGRSLQSKLRTEPGPAYVRDAQGNLATEEGQLLEQESDPRWVVSERVEYNNKGLPVRTYRPYFLNSHHTVNDASLREHGYYDTLHYDPLGRNTEVWTAAGYLRRITYGAWFDSHEDENDTAAEVEALRAQTV